MVAIRAPFLKQTSGRDTNMVSLASLDATPGYPEAARLKARHRNDKDHGSPCTVSSPGLSTKPERWCHGRAQKVNPTGVILTLRESLRKANEACDSYQEKYKHAEEELEKWHSAFQNESFVPAGTTPEPGLVVNALQNLQSTKLALKEQLEKAKKKEAAFIVNFAKREQEIAELKTAVRDLKSQLKPPSIQAQRLLLDPAIHEEFTRLKNSVEEKEKKVKELEENLAAVNFTPQSRMGKMLMAKCRTLQEENEEIGMMASEGKIHELQMKLEVQKSQNLDLRQEMQGLLEYMEELTEGVEKSHEMINSLKRHIEEKDADIKKLTTEAKKQRGGKEDKKTSDGGSAVDPKR